MSYSEVFGGATLYPAGQTYLELTFSTDQQLQWPIEQAVAGDNVASSIMDLIPTANGLNVDFADARQVSQGIQTVFNNVSGGGETVTIRDAAGGTILSIVDGTAWVVYLTDNSTLAGSWRIFQLGASVSVANAAALAGAGLKAVGSTLNQRIAPTSTAVTPITWTDSDRAQLTIWTGGVGVLDLPNPVTVGSDWFAMVRNGGSGSLTITPPSGTIDDGATLVLDPGQSATVVTDGTNFFTIGLGQSTAGFFDFLELNVAGSGDFTLSGVQLNRISYRFIGVLTGNRKIIVPSTVQQYWVDNSTTGAFTLEVATAAQVTPVTVTQGARNITYCDGTDVLLAESATVGFPIQISQGGTSATDAATALSNLGGAANTIEIQTAADSGLAGGGDLTVNRALLLDSDNLVAESTIDTAVDTMPFYDDDAGLMRKAIIDDLLPAPALSVYKLIDEAVTNSIAIQDDNELVLTSIPIGRYALEMYVGWRQQAGNSQGINIDFNIPVGSIVDQQYQLFAQEIISASALTAMLGRHTTSLAADLGWNVSTSNNNTSFLIQGSIEVTVACTLQFRWAQETADASPTIVEEGSWMRLTAF